MKHETLPTHFHIRYDVSFRAVSLYSLSRTSKYEWTGPITLHYAGCCGFPHRTTKAKRSRGFALYYGPIILRCGCSRPARQ
jgi:hypothetical protein